MEPMGKDVISFVEIIYCIHWVVGNVLIWDYMVKHCKLIMMCQCDLWRSFLFQVCLYVLMHILGRCLCLSSRKGRLLEECQCGGLNLKYFSGWWFQICFIITPIYTVLYFPGDARFPTFLECSPLFGEDEPISTSIFFKGLVQQFNHQLVLVSSGAIQGATFSQEIVTRWNEESIPPKKSVIDC